MVKVARTHLDAIGGKACTCCRSLNCVSIWSCIHGMSKFEIPKMQLMQVLHEIDMVIDRGAFLTGNYGRVFDEICKN
jgi:deoxyribose-phosphate aldolase